MPIRKITRKEGQPLWPWKYTKLDLQRQKANVGLSVWSALYQQTPLMSEIQEFKQEYFSYFEEREIAKKSMTIKFLIDPATGKKDSEQGCETGFMIVGKDKIDPVYFLLEDASGMLGASATIDKLFTKYLEYERTYPLCTIEVYFEANAYQQTLAEFIDEKMEKEQIYFSLTPITSTSDKEARIRGLEPLYRKGLMKHRQNMRNGKLEKQLIQFPVGKLKDRADALSFLPKANPRPTDFKNKKNKIIKDEPLYPGLM